MTARAAVGIVLATLLLAAAGCSAPSRPAAIDHPRPAPTPCASAARPITAAEIAGHIRLLADDALEGRGVGSAGIELAARYQENLFATLGLEPPFDGGRSHRQPLAVRGSLPDEGARLVFSVKKKTIEPRLLEDFVLNTHREDGPEEVGGELVYAGYLIQAPGRGWDDIKGADLSGKVLLVEVNEPGNAPGGIFDGRAMTYYGRWTYKFEQANRLGAKGVLIIHEKEGASYDWSVVRNSWSKESFFLPGEKQVTAFHGWISRPTAVKLLRAAGLDRDALRARAERPDFAPLATGIEVRARQRKRFRTVTTDNVAGLLVARHPRRVEGRTVVISAHYDHLGRDTRREGDQIFNGAVDNCSASATMLSLARYMAGRADQLGVNLLFFAPTAEEVGLLGSRYLVAHPPAAVGSIIANINFEMTNVWGATEDVYAIGGSQSDLDGICREAAGRVGLRYVAEQERENGFFFRSDQASFARGGIPGVWLHEGPTAAAGPADRIRRARASYRKQGYHTVEDEIRDDWDLAGAVQLARWAAAIVDLLGERKDPPRFIPTSAFRRRR